MDETFIELHAVQGVEPIYKLAKPSGHIDFIGVVFGQVIVGGEGLWVVEKQVVQQTCLVKLFWSFRFNQLDEIQQS